MSSEIKFSNLPVQSPTDTTNLMLVGFDLSKPVGSQDRVISAAGMLAVVAGGTLTAAGIDAILGYTPISSTGTVAAANILSNGQTLTYMGDATGTVSFNGSASENVTLTLASVGTSGTYSKVTVDAKGRVVSGSSITSTDVNNALGFAPMPNTSAAVISALGYTPISSTGTVTAASHFVTPQAVNLTGDATVSGLAISGTGTATGTIALSAVGTAGTYSTVTTDSKGRVIAGGPLTQAAVEAALGFVPMPSSGTAAAATILANGQNITFAGDVSGSTSFNGSVAVNSTLTLASVGTAGTYTKVTIDAKGRVVGGASLASSDVVSALGYTPAPSGTGTVAMAGQFVTPQAVTLSGDATVSGLAISGTGTATGALTLASVGTAGTYSYSVTTDAKGRVIAGTNYVPLTQAGANTNITAAQILSRNYHVDNYGAVGNATQYVSNYSIPFASNTLTSSTPVFNSLMVGQTVMIPGAGQNVTWPANGTWSGGTFPGYLVATITAYVSSTQVTLSAVADVALVNSYFPLTIGNDDSAAFNVALTALGNAGGGRLQISPTKRYLLASQQVSVPAFTGIWCENKPAYSSGVWNTQGGTLIVAAGSPLNSANSGSAGSGLNWNPERTTNAITLAGAGAWLENLYIMSPSVWPTQTALDQEAMVYGTQYGWVISGTGVQMDARSNHIKNCIVLGFSRGIINVPKKVSSTTGVYNGDATALPVIEDVKVVCATGLEFGPNGTTTTVRNPDCSNYVAPANVGGTLLNWNFAAVAPVSDGASGCILSMSGTGVTLGAAGNQASWVSGSNTYVGTPNSNGSTTITVTLYDNSGNPVTATGMTANRVTGYLISNGTGGFNLHLPNTPPTSFQSYGPFISGGVAQVGATGASAVPAQGAFTWAIITPGPAIYANNAQYLHIDAPKIAAGNGILLNSAGVVKIWDVDADGQQDAATATFGYAIAAINGCTDVQIIGGACNNFFGGLYNTSIVTPRGGDNFSITDFNINGPNVAIYQNGWNMSYSGGFLGHNGAILTGPLSQGLSINGGVVWATFENNSTSQVQVLQSTEAPAIYVTPDCIGAPTNLLPPIFNATVPVLANTIGGLPMDNSATTTSSVTLTQMLQQFGDALPASVIANNPLLGTTGQFWTAADAAGTSGATVAVAALIQAAAAWSSANGRAVKFPSGIYDVGTHTFSITQTNVKFICEPDTVFQSSQSTGYGTTWGSITGNGFTQIGGRYQMAADTYIDRFTGLIIANPDFGDWRTCCAGVWSNIPNYGAWQLSATQIAQNNTNVVYFDTLPSGYTLTSLQAQANTAPIYIQNHFIVQPGSYIASGSAIIQTTIGGWTGYQVTLTPPSGTTYAVISTAWAPIPAVVRQVPTPSNPLILERPAIAQPSVYMLASQPVQTKGSMITVHANHCHFENVDSRNATNGVFCLLKGDRNTFRGGKGTASAGYANCADIQIGGGDSNFVYDRLLYCGDQAMPLVLASVYVNGQFNSTSNLNITNTWFIGCRAISTAGSGPTFAVIAQIPNTAQGAVWTSNAVNNVGNTMVLPNSNFPPSHLSTTMLQYSAQAWGNSIAYSVGNTVVNNNTEYTCVTAGTSSATSTGPTGTSNGQTDGTVVWNYVAGSHNNAVSVYAYSPYLSGICTVVGYSSSGGNTTLTLAPPAGQTNAIATSIPSGKNITFLGGGTPLDSLTASITGSGAIGCHIASLGGMCVSPLNEDSQGVIDMTLDTCVLDSTWTIPALIGGYGGGAAIRVSGGDSTTGGITIRGKNLTFVNPYNYCVWANNGNITDVNFDSCYFPSPSQANPTILLQGPNKATIKNSQIWTAAGQSTIQLGGGGSTNGLGEVLSGTTQNARIRDNVFHAVQDTHYAVEVWQGNNHVFDGNILYPSTQGGTDQAGFVWVKSSATAPGYITFDRNDLSYINSATPVLNTGGLTLNAGFANVWSANATTTYSPNVGLSGTYTPAFSFATAGDSTFAYTAQVGTYYKVGQNVTFNATISFTPTYTTASGVAQISLPFHASASGAGFALNIASPDSSFSFPNSGTQIFGNIQTNSQVANIVSISSTHGTTTATIAQFVSGTAYQLTISGSYISSS